VVCCRLWGIVVLLAACWTHAPSQRAQAHEAEVAPVAREPFPLRSRWSGTFRCSQGITAVVLELTARPDGKLDATFTFGPTPENPLVAAGTYRLSGTIRAFAEGAFKIELRPERWIGAGPDGYMMVPMSGTSSRRWRRIAGKIEHPACGALDVRRSD
jgi:hypothetical protein